MAKQAKPKQDMGTGSVKKLMVKMAVPALVGQVVNLLYNIVDRIYIGHIPEIGGQALTGVGLFSPILMLITAFAMMAGSGGAPRAAIAMGQGDKERAEKILGNCFTVLVIFSVILTAVFYITCPTLLPITPILSFSLIPNETLFKTGLSVKFLLITIFFFIFEKSSTSNNII